MKRIAAIILLTGIVIVSCRKAQDVKPNVQTTISGQFYDSANQEGYANLKILIGEYQEIFKLGYPPEYNLIGYLTSTITDANGNYQISFTTSGNGSTYFLEFPGIPSNIFISDKGAGGAAAGYQRKMIENIGYTDVYNFEVLKSYYMKTRIIVNNDQFPPVNALVRNSSFQIGSSANSVFGTNNDTVKYIEIKKNTGGFYLYFTIFNPATKMSYSNSPIFLNPIINQDTIDGGSYILNPATFK